MEFDRLKAEITRESPHTNRKMAGIHRDIRQYFLQCVTRTEKEEIQKQEQQQNQRPHETSKQSENNGESDIRHININKMASPNQSTVLYTPEQVPQPQREKK